MLAMTGEMAEKILTSIPLVVGIIMCLVLLFSMNKRAAAAKHSLPSGRTKVSQLQQIEDLSSDDVLLITDWDKQESRKVSMAQLKAFIKS